MTGEETLLWTDAESNDWRGESTCMISWSLTLTESHDLPANRRTCVLLGRRFHRSCSFNSVPDGCFFERLLGFGGFSCSISR